MSNPQTSTPHDPARTRGTARPTVLAAATGTALAALLLAGCGAQAAGHSSEHGAGHSTEHSAAPEGATDHVEVDVAFASGMVVHHQGALAMAQDALQRASTPEVRALAERVVAAQQPEIDEMEGWLAAWGEDGGSHVGHDTAGMSGMSEGDSAALEAATGTDYDRLFLEQMTAHHRDAVEMAQQEQAQGSAPEAVALAERIEADQTAEIAEMAGLLQQLGA